MEPPPPSCNSTAKNGRLLGLMLPFSGHPYLRRELRQAVKRACCTARAEASTRIHESTHAALLRQRPALSVHGNWT
eukprot:1158665-Pelagomonas_calceolata.AAC.2